MILKRPYRSILFSARGTIEEVHDNYFSEMHPGMHGYTDGNEYNYWMNESGKIEFITYADRTYIFPDRETDGYGQAQAEKDAKKWFDQVFYQEETVFGKETETKSYAFNGGFYLTTLTLKYQGLDTGNSASISISADGKLISSAFIYSEKKPEEITKPVGILEDAAEELAINALLEECHELYGEGSILYTDQIREKNTELRIFRDQRFWEISFFIPTEHVANEEGIYDLYCEIRIEAETGECLGIATPLK